MIILRAIAVAVVVAVSVVGSSGAMAQGVELFAVLLGGNEVTNALPGDPQGDPGAGDKNG